LRQSEKILVVALVPGQSFCTFMKRSNPSKRKPVTVFSRDYPNMDTDNQQEFLFLGRTGDGKSCQHLIFPVKPFMVFCRYRPRAGAAVPCRIMLVELVVSGDAENAANEACPYLLWKQMGQASGLLVVDAHSKCHIPEDAVFDAEEYDDCITFGAKILSENTLA
jgi:hypothetical protein